MNNLIIIEDDSSSEEIIPARCSRVSSKAEKDICKSNTSSQELSSDETSEEFTQIGIECCSICLQFFDKNTDCLPCGHIFHHRCIFTQQGRLWIGKCPLCKGDVDGPQDARKLCVDPNELGGERMNTLLQSNRRLEKQIRKITSEHETLKERLEAKEKKIYLLKTIMKQNEAIERENYDDREIDLQTKEKYTEGIAHACCQSDDCEHAQKFINALRNLKRGRASAVKCQNIVSTANKKFIKHVIRKDQIATKGHSLDSFLPFYIERCRKLDYYIDIGEFNKRRNLFRYKEEVYEIFKDFGVGYDQEQLRRYQDVVREHKNSLIEASGSNLLDEDASTPKKNTIQREYFYDKDQRRGMLDNACKQLNEKQESINELMISIKKRPNFKIKSKESVKRELEVLKEQSQLLDKIKNYLVTREEHSLYYKSDEERKMAQIFKNYKNTKCSEPKNCKRRTYKQFRSERFRN